MFKSVKGKWKQWSDFGLRLPYAHDPVSDQASVTLLMVYMTFMLAFVSNILLHFYISMTIATWTSMIFWAMSYVFYRIRKIDKATVDFKNSSFSLTAKHPADKE